MERFDNIEEIGREEEFDEEIDHELAAKPQSQLEVKIYLWEFNQNDPKRDSGVKLCRMGLASKLKIGKPFNGIVLSAEATKVISKEDIGTIQQFGIAGINCSWNRLSEVPVTNLGKSRNQRKLPLIYAANTVNYGKAWKMNTAEALAAALYIMGYTEDAVTIMYPFSFGPEFLRINSILLEAYQLCRSEREVVAASSRFLSDMEDAKQEKSRALEARQEKSQRAGNIGGYMDDMDLPPMHSEVEYDEEDEADGKQYVV